MSVNKYLPHILVLPEDKADSDIANGFLLHPQLNDRSIQILSPAGGWKAVVDKFEKSYVTTMLQHLNRYIVLLIDFDEKEDRFEYINQRIPDNLKSRVFILGIFAEPEDLKKTLKKSFESIGETLAISCANNTSELWEHDLLKHNKPELERMISSVKPFLFNQAR